MSADTPTTGDVAQLTESLLRLWIRAQQHWIIENNGYSDIALHLSIACAVDSIAKHFSLSQCGWLEPEILKSLRSVVNAVGVTTGGRDELEAAASAGSVKA